MYEYTTEVFSVGINGLAPVDEALLEELAEDGWEPTLMTPVHNGFATLVMFRREAVGGRPGLTKAKPAKKVAKAPARKVAKTPAKPAPAPRASSRASAGRVRRAR